MLLFDEPTGWNVSLLSLCHWIKGGGVKVQLEQGRDGASRTWRRSGSSITGALFQIPIPYDSLYKSIQTCSEYACFVRGDHTEFSNNKM